MLYKISHKISWKDFKKINKNVKADIVPVHFDKILWQMLRDQLITLTFDTKKMDILIKLKKYDSLK